MRGRHRIIREENRSAYFHIVSPRHGRFRTGGLILLSGTVRWHGSYYKRGIVVIGSWLGDRVIRRLDPRRGKPIAIRTTLETS
jgi:hypothetical protein